MTTLLLKDFYKAVQTAIDNGDPDRFLSYEDERRTWYRSLCGALAHWVKQNQLIGDYYVRNAEAWALRNELCNQFEDAGLDTVFPFNEPAGLSNTYWSEKEAGTTWYNPKRLAWVKEHAA